MSEVTQGVRDCVQHRIGRYVGFAVLVADAVPASAVGFISLAGLLGRRRPRAKETARSAAQSTTAAAPSAGLRTAIG